MSGAGGLCLASPLPSPLWISNVVCIVVGRLLSEKLRISPSKVGWESGQHRVLASEGGGQQVEGPCTQKGCLLGPPGPWQRSPDSPLRSPCQTTLK